MVEREKKVSNDQPCTLNFLDDLSFEQFSWTIFEHFLTVSDTERAVIESAFSS